MFMLKPRHMEKPEGWVGIPSYHAHGSFLFNKAKLRFLVLDRLFVNLLGFTNLNQLGPSFSCRFGTDLDKVFKGGEKPFPLATVLNIGLQVNSSESCIFWVLLTSAHVVEIHTMCHSEYRNHPC